MGKLLEYIINFIINKSILWPFYCPIIHFMKEVEVDNRSKYNGITILALNFNRFRGDLKILARSGFRVLIMPYSWQTRVFYAYKDRGKLSKEEFQNPSQSSSIYKDRARLRKYLKKLLKKIFFKNNINCIITANIFYNQDFDWSAVAVDIGCPYIVFHRENLVVNDHMYLVESEYAKMLNRIGFVGGAIVFQNEIMKSIYDKYSGLDKGKVHALGSLRMDKYIHNVKSKKNKSNNGRVVLFTFPPNSAICGESEKKFAWQKLHDDVHISFLELAIENPDVEFVIKHKGVGWEITKSLLTSINANVFNIDNLKIYGESSSQAQELILESDVITGFCTTALSEAAIAEKPIVYQLFAEASDEKYSDFLCFRDALDMFDVAKSKKEYKSLIMQRMQNPAISKKIMKFRELQFERHVSSLDSDALQKYSELIFSKVQNSNIANNK